MRFLEEELSVIDRQGLRRQLREVSTPQGRTICFDGQTVLNFCSNDYLGLANDARLKEAAIGAINDKGVGTGAARLVCGNMPEHTALEERIARLKQSEACLVFSTGYMANIGVIPALVGRDDVILADKLNHACLVDGAVLSRATVKRYAHADVSALEKLLKEASGARRRLIVTDSVFSMDGDCAPLEEIVALAKQYDAMVMVDEAHGFGVLGARGAGLVESLDLHKDVTVKMGTLSKAAGCFGAYVCGSRSLIDYLMHRARSFVYTTGLPPSVAAAACRAVDVIEDSGKERRLLLQRAARLRVALERGGFKPPDSSTQIVPVLIGDAVKAVAFSQRLLEQGFFVQAIRPPTVPQGTARLRITLTAAHTDEDVNALVSAMKTIGEELCLT